MSYKDNRHFRYFKVIMILKYIFCFTIRFVPLPILLGIYIQPEYIFLLFPTAAYGFVALFIDLSVVKGRIGEDYISDYFVRMFTTETIFLFIPLHISNYIKHGDFYKYYHDYAFKRIEWAEIRTEAEREAGIYEL